MLTPRTRLTSVLLVAALVVTGCGSDGPASEKPKDQKQAPAEKPREPAVPSANFNVLNLRAIDPRERPEANGKAEEQKAAVLNLVNGFYNAAFLDPAKWAGGTHPDLPAFFTQQAQAGLAANLGTLALTDIATSIKSVKPDREEITRLTMYLGDDLSVPVGVATVAFDATATPTASGAPPVIIRHNADLWLQREGDGYKISAYRADINAQSQPGSGG